MRRKIVILLLLILCLSLIGCFQRQTLNSSEHDNMVITETTNEKNNIVEGVDEKSNQKNAGETNKVYPLTGIEAEEIVNERPISVMVNNQVQARPQSGLAKADLIFEFLTEGNITRFLAIFQSEQPEVVGPVRSAREYFFELAQGYSAIYIYHGAAQSVNDLILKGGIEHLNGALYDNDGYLFKRETFRKAPHNSYLLFDAVYDESKAKNYDIIKEIQPLPFIDNEELMNSDGEGANHIQIAYPGKNDNELIEYIYDEDEEAYYRTENNEKTIELNSEEMIFVQNVFIIEAAHQIADTSSGRRKIDLKSGGTAYLFQKGRVQRVDWKNDQGRLIPYKDGEPLGFTPGKTWTNIVPSNPGIESVITY